MARKPKKVQIVIRGCLMWVKEEDAAELRKAESEMMRKDWKENRVD